MAQAIHDRHTVRKYLDEPLDKVVAQALEQHLEELNQQMGLSLSLVQQDPAAFNAALRAVLAKGACNYIVLAADEAQVTWGAKDVDPAHVCNMALGYAGADAMLFSQRLGLNTWWVGGTYSRKYVSGKVGNKHVVGIIVVGYGATHGRAHKSKTAAEVSSYAGDTPRWFTKGVQAALLAPTALNRQDFYLDGNGNSVHLSYPGQTFSALDAGIARYFFEQGAGTDNFSWELVLPIRAYGRRCLPGTCEL